MAVRSTVSAKLDQTAHYRSPYTVIDTLTVAVINLGHRRDVYDCSPAAGEILRAA